MTLLARAVLIIAFAWAALSKLNDRPGTSAAAADLGVPRRLAGAAAVALPIAELGVAVALVPAATATAAAYAAFALLAAFTLALIASLLRGRRPTCHCFGRLSAHPAGWLSVGRNLVLAGLAATVALGGPGNGIALDLSGRERWLAAAAALLLATTVTLAWVVAVLLRRHGDLLVRLDEIGARPNVARALADGAAAPSFPQLQALRRLGPPVLLVFIDPDCAACNELLPRIATWQSEYSDRLTVAVISAADVADELDHVVLDIGGAVRERYGVGVTPTAMLVDREALIAAKVAGAEPITKLVQTVTHDAATPRPGDTAPDFAPPGEPALLLFVDATCPACEEVQRELEGWEEYSGIRLVVVDAVAQSARALGVRGTPSALLVDADGTIATALAEGPSAIRILAQLSPRTAIEASR
jgi:thiol-disulfide isomerase/thioredoxin